MSVPKFNVISIVFVFFFFFFFISKFFSALHIVRIYNSQTVHNISLSVSAKCPTKRWVFYFCTISTSEKEKNVVNFVQSMVKSLASITTLYCCCNIVLEKILLRRSNVCFPVFHKWEFLYWTCLFNLMCVVFIIKIDILFWYSNNFICVYT